MILFIFLSKSIMKKSNYAYCLCFCCNMLCLSLLGWCSFESQDVSTDWNSYVKQESLESYYCRWVWNLQWDSALKTNKLFESDDAWWWGYSESEWQKKRNDINTMYNNCISYKSSIKNDIEKYWYLMNSLNVDENVLAYCIWKRKYLRSFNEPESQQYDWAIKFTPNITISDDSYISSSIASCNEELSENITLLNKNMWQ